MDLFRNAKAVRLKNNHNKYLHAEDDEESVSQDRNGSSKNNRWTVEFVQDSTDDNITIIRLKSCYNKYLTASNQPFLLGMTGRKVLQTVPRRLDSSVEWEPIREGNQVKLRTRYGQYLRANGGLPPWRNSVTHDVPHRTATQEWVLWDVDVVDIVLHSPAPRPPPPLVYQSTHDNLNDDSFTSSETSSSPTPFSRQQSSDSHHDTSSSSPPKFEGGRAIYYHVVSEDFGEMDENAQGFCIMFKGNNVNDLTRKLEEETGLNDITVCTRSPLNGKLYPLRLQLPPNNVTMKVVVVQNNMEDAIDGF
nr:actin cross-linking [Tanacetum cinerariifolium]